MVAWAEKNQEPKLAGQAALMLLAGRRHEDFNADEVAAALTAMVNLNDRDLRWTFLRHLANQLKHNAPAEELTLFVASTSLLSSEEKTRLFTAEA